MTEASVAQLGAEMAAGRLTARALAQEHLDRIEALDRGGPRLRSIIELNPDALTLADELDAERAANGPRGPLHGVPVLLKDNIATGDAMATTAGSLALDGVVAARDARLVARLRDAGVVILAKTNLSEWANIRSTRSTSGWSARGGLTRNPHVLDRNPSGSSSGTAVAIAAGLAAVGVGTETDGSIVSPSSINGIVGLKPTVGLVSGDGIVPISHSQDTAGPMTRTVADAAALLGAIAEADHDYASSLDPKRLAGARIGAVRPAAEGRHPEVDGILERSLDALRAGGAVVEEVELELGEALGEAELDVLLHELRAGLERWLAEFAPQAPVATLADVIAWNRRHAADEMPWFGQELFERAQALGGLDEPRYLDALATCRRLSREEGIDAVLAAGELDALVSVTAGPAWLTDVVHGDRESGSFSTPAAVAGYPHLTVPAGFIHGLPVGLSFVGPAWSEQLLLDLGCAFEQATGARRPPAFAATASQ